MAAERSFRTGVDWWITVVLVVVAAMAPIFLWQALAIVDSEPLAAAGLLASAVLVIVVLAGLLWPVDYTCTTDALRVRSGWIRYRVPYREIRSVAPSRAAWSSPALSMDRLRIDYGQRWLLISPADKAGFLTELRRRAPHLYPTADGGLSANTD